MSYEALGNYSHKYVKELEKQRDELLTALERIGAWLEDRHLSGLMPQERELIAKVKGQP